MQACPIQFSAGGTAGITAVLAQSVILALLLLNAPAAHAQSYADGERAYLAEEYDKALAILRPLAEQGDSDAQVTLGLMYDHGHGVARDPQQAVAWYSRAAEQGVAAAQHDLGVKYFQGKGIEQDYRKAARWWQQAADAGLADSQFNLGLMYYHGQGLTQDYVKAAGLFQRAADQDYVNAQYTLAIMYATGQGIPQDYDKALPLFRKAANQGLAEAQYNLGVFYENGHGVARDTAVARRWYRQAADQSVTKAQARLEKLASDKTEGPAADTASRSKTSGPQDSSAAAAPAPESSANRKSSPAATVTESESTAARPATFPDSQRNSWLRQQVPDKFTIQLLSTTDEAAARQYVQAGDLGAEAGYVEVVIKGTTRYNVVVGIFDSREAAQKAAAELSDHIRREQKPWVRNIGLLQEIMQ